MLENLFDNMPPRLNLFAAIRHAHSSSASASGVSRARDGILHACKRSSGYTPTPFSLVAPVESYQKRMSSTNGGHSKGRGAEAQDAGDVPLGPNQDQLPHVSEEAAQTARILEKRCGEVSGPELEQGTPIEEVSRCRRDCLSPVWIFFADRFLGIRF